ncbi:hypothetical protein [Propionicicella superfundia]|uniref:hypothetical protein n=1 Tax=Propionicicella superfundia TaxID=348582 RepID=UPI0004298058|nr:hypothetical protein [Propionicicella superfundia]
MSVHPLSIILVFAVVATPVLIVVLIVRATPPAHRIPGLVKVAAVVGIAIAALGMLLPVLASLAGDSTTVSVPLEPFTPHIADGIELAPASATILGGGIDRATLSLTGLSWTTRILLALSRLAEAGAIIAVSLLALKLARSVQADDPFRAGSKAHSVAAIVVTAGGVAGSVLGDLGSWRAGREALDVAGWGASASHPITETTALAQYGWPEPMQSFTLTVPWWPLLGGLGLALIATAFRAGERLRDDTRGLV